MLGIPGRMNKHLSAHDPTDVKKNPAARVYVHENVCFPDHLWQKHINRPGCTREAEYTRRIPSKVGYILPLECYTRDGTTFSESLHTVTHETQTIDGPDSIGAQRV